MKYKIEPKDLKGKIPNDLYKAWFEYDDINNLDKLNETGVLAFGQCDEKEPVFDGNCFIFINNLNFDEFIKNVISNAFAFTNQKPKIIYVLFKWTHDNATHTEICKTDICKILFNSIPYIQRSGDFGDLNILDDAADESFVYYELYNLFNKMNIKNIEALINYIPIFEKSCRNYKHFSITRTWLLQKHRNKKSKRFWILQWCTFGLSIIGIIVSLVFGILSIKK